MKLLLLKIKNLLSKYQAQRLQVKLRKEINSYASANLTTFEIEAFLNISFNDFDQAYFNKFYPKFAYLYSDVTSLQLLKYIEEKNNFKKTIENSLLKKLAYPIFLLIFSLVILIVFKKGILPLLADYISLTMLLLINIAYYLSLLLVTIICLLLIFIAYIIYQKDLYIIVSKRLLNKPITLLDYYYQQIFTYLIISYYQAGYSTKDIFLKINKYKDNPITANLAYFINNDLDLGLGIKQGLNAMRVSEDFKRILILALEQENFIKIISSYHLSLKVKIDNEINKYSKILYAFVYAYLLILLILFYSILSLPLKMIDIL